jgi:pyruvate kinase
VSFARDAADIELARKLLREAGGHGHICAKIERHEAIHNLTEIIDASDVLMVARGDLAVEMGYAELTGLQKTIIHESRTRNKVVITATQMMESMISSPVPTRAEVSDVANAVMDGTDAVMLSAESAVGKYPIKAIQAMEEVIAGAEKYEIKHNRMRTRTEGIVDRTEEAIAMAVMYTANHMKVRAIVALTESGTHAAVDVARAARTFLSTRSLAMSPRAAASHCIAACFPCPSTFRKCAPTSCSRQFSP